MGPPPLEIASFGVAEVHAAAATRWQAGRLEIDIDGLAVATSSEAGIVRTRAAIVRPGEPVRLVNVLDAVEPQVKADSRRATFPGVIGDEGKAGAGRTNRLDGVAVVTCADLRATHDPAALEVQPDGDAVVDMGGPAAALSRWSQTTNLVLEFECDPDTPLADLDVSLRRAALSAARRLADATVGATADEVETIDLRDGRADLPAIAVILQVGSEGPLCDTYLYGRSARDLLPTVLDPCEVLDGALTAGHYDWAGGRTPTFFYQRSALLRALARRHGRSLRLVGVVATLCYLPSGEEKERAAAAAAGLARDRGAAGVVVATFQTGNSHTDTMLTLRACEACGLRGVAIVAETDAGLADFVPEADALVSAGNEEELLPAWRPEAALGGRLVDGGDPRAAGRLPAAVYLGAVSQMGDTFTTAETW
jgi:glycine reductase